MLLSYLYGFTALASLTARCELIWNFEVCSQLILILFIPVGKPKAVLIMTPAGQLLFAL